VYVLKRPWLDHFLNAVSLALQQRETLAVVHWQAYSPKHAAVAATCTHSSNCQQADCLNEQFNAPGLAATLHPSLSLSPLHHTPSLIHPCPLPTPLCPVCPCRHPPIPPAPRWALALRSWCSQPAWQSTQTPCWT
jgi:hypothetical protein